MELQLLVRAKFFMVNEFIAAMRSAMSSSPTPPPFTAPRVKPPRAAHLVLGEHTGAASAYVAMTRGRDTNVAHVVAEDLDDARQQWAAVFSRDRADLGPAHAADLAAEEAAKY